MYTKLLQSIWYALYLIVILISTSDSISYADETEALNYLCDKMDKFIQTDQPKLIESYDTPYPPGPYDNNTRRSDLYSLSFIYDAALAACVFIDEGKKTPDFNVYTKKAKQICEAIVWHKAHDPKDDGRIRDVYYATQDLTASSISLIPEEWAFSRSSLGNMSWAIIALLRYYTDATDPDTAKKNEFLQAAIAIGEFIHLRLYDPSHKGYLHNIDRWNNVAQYKSAEQNITTYVAFMKLYEATQDNKWQLRAAYAKDYVEEACWYADEKLFFPGTDASNNINRDIIALDANTLAVLAFGKPGIYKDGIEYNYNYLRYIDNNREGFDFGINVNPYSNWYSPVPDGIWYEGTSQMACAYQLLDVYGYGGEDYAGLLLNNLDYWQANALNADGRSLVAASRNSLTTGYDWFYYYASPHVASTAWYIAAHRYYNLLWGIKTEYGNRIPYDINHPPVIDKVSDLTLEAGKEFRLKINASDPDNEQIHFLLGPNIPSFAQAIGYIDYAEIVFRPAQNDLGKYSVTIGVDDRWGGQDSTVFTVTVTPSYISPAFLKGWNLISIPAHPLNPAIQTIFKELLLSEISNIFTWDAHRQSYIRPTTIEEGKAYWLYLFSPKSLSFAGEETGDNFEATLSKGWNTTGNPYNIPITASNLKIKYNGQIKTLKEAGEEGLIILPLWRWDGQYKYYKALKETDPMAPWDGIWIYSFVSNVTLIYSRISENSQNQNMRNDTIPTYPPLSKVKPYLYRVSINKSNNTITLDGKNFGYKLATSKVYLIQKIGNKIRYRYTPTIKSWHNYTIICSTVKVPSGSYSVYAVNELGQTDNKPIVISKSRR